jgi:glycosyltransferase involved in cell wall biosynthesis
MTTVLLVHNRYRSQMASGENRVVDQESELLRRAGHTVIPFVRDSDDIAGFGAMDKAGLPARVVWSGSDRREFEEIARRTRPDVVHIHNTFPLISPSVVHAATAVGVPIVMTLHNFRLFCANGMLFRDGHVCESCLGASPIPGLVHACYRGSRLATAPITVNIAVHRRLETWDRVATFIVLSEFARTKVAAGGLPEDRLVVKPNSVRPPKLARDGAGEHLVYLGRLSVEKGPDLLLSAWSPDLGTLLIVGDGPSRDALRKRAHGLGDSVRFLGHRSAEECSDILRTARALIVPSRVYEGFPMAVAEAYAHGVPVIAPDHGPFPDIVDEGSTGLLFRPGDPVDLGRRIRQLADEDLSLQMGLAARRAYEARYTPERNLAALESIYDQVIAAAPPARLTSAATVTGPVPMETATTSTRLFPTIGPVTAGVLFHGIEGAPRLPHDAAAWDEELPLLLGHRLTGLASAAASSEGVLLPEDVRAQLHASHLRTTARALAVESTAIDVLRTLEGRRIPYVVTKGPGIARAYPDPALRPYGDLDVLVAPERFNDALDAIVRTGFTAYFEGGEPRSYFDRHCREGVNLIREDGGSIDLHHVIPPWVWGERLPFGRLLDRSNEIEIAGGKARVLAPEHNLLVACLHVVSDRGVRPGYKLMTWRDVVTLSEVCDPAVVVFEARRAHLDWYVSSILRELPPSVQPTSLLGKLGPGSPSRGDAFRLHRLLPPAVGSKHQIAQAFRLPLPNACAFLAGYAFPSRRFLRKRYVDGGGYVRWWREATDRLRDARDLEDDGTQG